MDFHEQSLGQLARGIPGASAWELSDQALIEHNRIGGRLGGGRHG